ncbi:MAG: 16S rRNA (guanine(966)-N(2))-methyltransferase RsmD [Proteobacteria bacterium]|uniref:16S rRNA (guanine(966)-N(2))-methyltransferase RsmD n=1 Tax=Aquabacterium sp. TaxID=1872578 RepID=UPI0035C6E0C2|nr:16S rRNA (guanine(966)-N(2))-methyltransferase RsmD [Pseudomonadota bacterium]
MSSAKRPPPGQPSGRRPAAPAGGVRDRQERAAQAVARTAAQEVRIIGGQWKRSPLPVPVSAGLRPTSSRVRETLFNWLGQDLTGWRVLDAFAGSGALGLEAASRGASAVLLERDAGLVASLRKVVLRLQASQVQVVQTDALDWMRRFGGGASDLFDLVLLDPPFDEALFQPALAAAAACVPPGGWVYAEAPHSLQAQVDVPGLRCQRHGQAGAVHFHLFQRGDAAPGAAEPSA